MGTPEKVDLFMPTCNRFEYTRVALESLVQTSDQSLVNQLILVDSGSQDGTREYLEDFVKRRFLFPAVLIKTGARHIVHSMLAAREAAKSQVIAKIDSDSVPPPGWLPVALEVMRKHPELWALGIVPRGNAVVPAKSNVERTYEPERYVGGVGLFRRDAWKDLKPEKAPYWGWTTHQYNSSWIKGWLKPYLPLFLLDQLPFEPFVGLRKKYFELGSHRTQGGYSEAQEGYWSWRYPDWRKSMPPQEKR